MPRSNCTTDRSQHYTRKAHNWDILRGGILFTTLLWRDLLFRVLEVKKERQGSDVSGVTVILEQNILYAAGICFSMLVLQGSNVRYVIALLFFPLTSFNFLSTSHGLNPITLRAGPSAASRTRK